MKFELAHVLQFVTGCPALPATGFDTNLTIVFDHEEIQRKLSANTCSCTLNIPVCDLLASYTYAGSYCCVSVFEKVNFKTALWTCKKLIPGENSCGLVHLEYQYRSDMHYFHLSTDYIVKYVLVIWSVMDNNVPMLFCIGWILHSIVLTTFLSG